MSDKKYNYMIDVAASIESDRPFEDIPLDYMVAAFLKRLANILEERDYEAIALLEYGPSKPSEADCAEVER